MELGVSVRNETKPTGCFSSFPFAKQGYHSRFGSMRVIACFHTLTTISIWNTFLCLVLPSLLKWHLFSPGTCRLRTIKGYCCFPFMYRRRRYNGCARNRRGRRWCAITPNYRKNKLWGYCRGGTRRKFDFFYPLPDVVVGIIRLNFLSSLKWAFIRFRTSIKWYIWRKRKK